MNTKPETTEIPLDVPIVTEADHEAGCKDVAVTFRSGRKASVKLIATSALKLAELESQPFKTGVEKQMAILQACAPEGFNVDRLDARSLGHVMHVSIALTYGLEAQKKREAELQDALQTLLKIYGVDSAAAGEPSSAVATP